jgi:LysR family transcriptional activator of nhaA
LDQWLDRQGVRPLLLGEFEDYAMLREFARAGHGFAPVPAVLEAQFRRENGFARIGMAHGVTAEFFAISAERKIKHPAVAAMTDRARQLFAQS